jgi:hypothetical protein
VEMQAKQQQQGSSQKGCDDEIREKEDGGSM